MIKPKVSVVTVCYNSVDTIEKTIQSVINQTYDNIEYIIIDGASTDGTQDIINKYRDKIAHCISEPDKGIYDAMNKSLAFLNGDFVVFLNSGDVFYATDTIASVFSFNTFSREIDVIYGDTKYLMKWGWYERRPDKMDIMRIRCPFCHQSAFIRSEVLIMYQYDTRFKFAADYNFFHQIWIDGHKMEYVPITISVFNGSIPSFSGKHPFLVRREEQDISNDKTMSNKFFFFFVFLKACLAKMLLVVPFSSNIRSLRFKNNPLIKSYKIIS